MGRITLNKYEGNLVIGSKTGEFRNLNPLRYEPDWCWG